MRTTVRSFVGLIMKTEPENLAERLAVEFNRANKTQAEAAGLCNADKSTIARWVSGSLTPNDDQIKKLADYFGLHFIELKYGKAIFKSASYAYAEKYSEEDKSIDEEIALAYGLALARVNRDMINCREDRELFKAILIKSYLES